MDFVESIVLELPDMSTKVDEFSEAQGGSGGKNKKALIIEVASIHAGTTANHNLYTEQELTNSLESWTQPYNKPIILNHDPETEAVGRVVGATIAHEADGTPYTKLQAMIVAPEAIQKIKDKRYLTGSVGGKAEAALCTICQADWAKKFMACEHERGKEYEGKVAAFEMKGVQFKEYSFVNMPADGLSGVRSLKHADGSETMIESEVASAKVFGFEQGIEAILEFKESTTVDVLSKLSETDAHNVYEKVEAQFLSAIAESDIKDEIEDVIEEEADEDDVLAALESLTNEDEGDDEDEGEDADDETESPEDDDEPEDVSDEVEGDDTEDDDADEEPAETADEENAEESEEVEDEVEEVHACDHSELDEKIVFLESRVQELETSNATLANTNSKLKDAIKRMLAENVVDTRISLGLEAEEDRNSLMEEYSSRSARSLADSLKDLHKSSGSKSIKTIAPIKSAILSVGEDNINSVEVTDGSAAKEKSGIEQVEDRLVEILMGRKNY